MTASLDDMRVFDRLAVRGSFSRAAVDLGVTKQTVSRRIDQLERDLGVELVRRTSRTVRLTDVGRAYAERCAEVVRLADEANRLFVTRAGVVAGTLRVTADPTLGETLLPGLVHRFCADHPQVAVEVLVTARKVDLLEEGIDVALRVGRPPAVTYLASARLGPARLVTVAAPGYLARRGTPDDLDALTGHDCLAAMPRLGQPAWPMMVDGAVKQVPVASRLSATGLTTVLHAARAGLGIAHLPAFAVAPDLASGALVRLLPAHAVDVGGVHAVYPHSRLLAPAVVAFVSACRAWATTALSAPSPGLAADLDAHAAGVLGE